MSLLRRLSSGSSVDYQMTVGIGNTDQYGYLLGSYGTLTAYKPRDPYLTPTSVFYDAGEDHIWVQASSFTTIIGEDFFSKLIISTELKGGTTFTYTVGSANFNYTYNGAFGFYNNFWIWSNEFTNPFGTIAGRTRWIDFQ